MIKFWKPFRVVVSLIVLVLTTFVFVDFKQVAPGHLFKAVTFLQFVPSARSFLVTAGILTSGFVVVLLLTLLVGRVYCSTICPLGILQDVISWVAHRFNRKTFRYKYAKAYTALRYVFLGAAILPLFFGSIVAVYLLDPYSNFGRIASDLGRPVYINLNNALALLLIKFKVYSIAPFDIASFNLLVVLFPILVLAVILWLASTRGRLYCNTICPVGTLLGLLSKISIFKIHIDQSSCTKCTKCAVVCKAQCISVKEQTVDESRCVGCFNCLKACDNSSIRYKLARPVKASRTERHDSSKRTFLTTSALLTGGALLGLGKVVGAQEPEQHPHHSGKSLTPVNRKHFCSPPGSQSIAHFNSACTSCHLCVSACPNDVLQPSFYEYGLGGVMQPFMDYHTGYCNYDCTKCGEVCPTGAILPLTITKKKSTQLGIAQFMQHNCVVFTDETSCGSCSEHCPTQAVAMVPYKGELTIPHVTAEICIGCGACERVCPAKPNKAIYVEGNVVHQSAKRPEVKKNTEKKMEEFPF
jgi:polyferredoxin